jgi:cell division protein FtsZ
VKIMRNRLHTRRKLLKALLAASGTAVLPRIWFPSHAVAGQDSGDKAADNTELGDRIIERSDRVATNIKVVGVGGAGVTAVALMVRQGLRGVEFVSVDTDERKLCTASAGTRILLGHNGGVEKNPEIARDLAIASRTRIANALQGADLVFVVAGLGGGTGTGAAPVVAELARGIGLLTVATAITPFVCEGRHAADLALQGVSDLHRLADTLILIPHESLVQRLPGGVSVREAMNVVDMLIRHAVGGIADSINLQGLVNIDVDDLRWAITGAGICITGSGCARGTDRARLALLNALSSSSMRPSHPDRWQRVLVCIRADPSLELREYKEVIRPLRSRVDDDTGILCGLVLDDSMRDQVRVTIVAAGQTPFHPSYYRS